MLGAQEGWIWTQPAFTATLSESDSPVVSAIDAGGFGPGCRIIKPRSGKSMRVSLRKQERAWPFAHHSGRDAGNSDGQEFSLPK